MLSAILNLVCPVRQQKATKMIYRPELNTLLRPFQEVKLSDSNYKLVDTDQLQKFLKRNATSERQYLSNSNDCDDFSFILMGDVCRWDSDLAFGIAWGYNSSGEYHAFNVFVDTQKNVQLVEPQSDEVFLVPDEWNVRFVLM